MKFLPFLALMFIAFKLLGVITWSWWLVLLPVYIIPVIFFSSMIAGFVWVIRKVIKEST